MQIAACGISRSVAISTVVTRWPIGHKRARPKPAHPGRPTPRLRAMSDAADAAPQVRGSYARATSIKPLADFNLLVQLGPIPGTSPRATMNDLQFAAIQLRGKLIRHGVVQFTAGSGKSHSLGVLLRSALVLRDAKAILDEAQDQRATADLARRLLSSAEKDTRLPSITTPVSRPTTIWGTGPALAPDELAAASKVVALFWLATVDLLSGRLEPGRYELGSQAPPHESSPCGVIGLSAPRVPRAPGGLAALPAPSHMCALAA